MIIARGPGGRRAPEPAEGIRSDHSGRASIATEHLLGLAAGTAGIAAWLIHLHAGLVLSHYDARAHLVVARRVIDNITPGWQQIGAVWLPLPHLLQILPVQIDVLYRTGASGSMVSIAAFAVAAWAAARLVLVLTGSRLGAVTSALLLVLNPNLLYLQATPMTEPLLVAVTFAAVLLLVEWATGGVEQPPRLLGAVLFAATWTRYEAWMVLAAALPFTGWAMCRQGVPVGTAIRRIVRIARWPAAAVGFFVVNSRIAVGSWFVTGGFYVPDPGYQGLPLKTIVAIWWGTHQMSGYVIETAALAVAAVLCVRASTRRTEAALLVPVALLASAALPFYAFVEGHPFRIRYMVPLMASCAILCGTGVGLLANRRLRPGAQDEALIPSISAWRLGLAAAVLLVVSLVVESPPWDRHAPMLEEAQWDVPASLERRQVTDCLAGGYAGGKIMASMGSLAHYMQELSHAGIDLADFVHEGTGSIWNLAIGTGPAPHAAWMLVEEQAEGGDVLAQRIRRDPGFLRGMQRTCEGGGVALYRRDGPV